VEDLYASAPDDQLHIQRYLSAHCFGDHYTRTGVDVPTRELLTFSMLVSLGGCEAQVEGHVAANLNVGNDRARLIDVLTQLLPFIGYPRTLNALRVVDEVAASWRRVRAPHASSRGLTRSTWPARGLGRGSSGQTDDYGYYGRTTMPQRTWFISGVSSGFGRQLSEQLLERGDRVVGTVRDNGKVTDLLERYAEAFHAETLDVTDTAAIREVVERSFARFERIDVIVSNAGYGLFGAAEELSDEEIDHMIATNLVGSIQLIRTALPHLRAQDGGRVIQISSYG
jgi:alkylhydroperoxidase/carboxymuconolactone decarboxylase family protein YurZ